jgi:hypothetical protein
MLPRQCQGVNAEANCSGSLSLSTQQRKRNACCCMLHAGSTGNRSSSQQPAAHCALRTAARHAWQEQRSGIGAAAPAQRLLGSRPDTADLPRRQTT